MVCGVKNTAKAELTSSHINDAIFRSWFLCKRIPFSSRIQHAIIVSEMSKILPVISVLMSGTASSDFVGYMRRTDLSQK